MLFAEGKYPIDLVLLENTSMTLTEADGLKENDPERYYRFLFFILEKMKKEKEKVDELKDKAGGSGSGSGESDTFIMIPEEIPLDFVSEIGEIKDE